MPPLSVLDLSPSRQAFRRRRAAQQPRSRGARDRSAYTRYWVAEHHNLPSIASSAPDIMIGQIAAGRDAPHPRRIGRRMLPNHAPLVRRRALQGAGGAVSGRIDLGDRPARPAPSGHSIAAAAPQGISDDDGFSSASRS